MRKFVSITRKTSRNGRADNSAGTAINSSGAMTNLDHQSTDRLLDDDGDPRDEEDGTSTSHAFSTGSGAKPTSTHSSFEKGHGKSGTNLALLSGKTDNIMATYQAYLEDIQTDTLTNFSSSNEEDEETMIDPALANIHEVRENVRCTYEEKEHIRTNNSRVVKDESFAMIGGGSGEPLQREWSHENSYTSTPIIHGDNAIILEQMDSDGRRHNERYAYPWLHSKRIKRGVVAFVSLSALLVIGGIGISVGVSNNDDKNTVGIPDWEEEYMEAAEEEEEELHLKMHKIEQEMDRHVGDGESTTFPNAFADKEQEMTKESSSIQDSSGNVVASWQSEAEDEKHNRLNSEYSGPSETSGVEQEQQQQQTETIISEPLDKNSHQEQITDEAGDNANDANNLYSNAIIKYGPVIYDRSKGWTGKTYREALIFCEVAAGLALCPYDAVCPDGYDGEPLGGFRDGPHGDWAWIPVIDGRNDWVQAGAREKCVRYSHKFGGVGPEWGITGQGIGVEGITRNVLCCAHVM